MSESSPSILPRKRVRSLGEEVMKDLVAKIQAGRHRPGDKLPTEPEIMAEQGVSRTVVREAISRLQAAGFVETRHGVGTFVLAPPVRTGTGLDVFTVVTIRDVLAMLEMRTSLETEAAALAAQRRTEAQLDGMKRTLDSFDATVDSGGSAVDADYQFHLQIAQATANRYFEDFSRHLGKSTIPRTQLQTARLAGSSDAEYLRQVSLEHRYILDAIERRDHESARAGMRMHLTNSCERLRRASAAMDA